MKSVKQEKRFDGMLRIEFTYIDNVRRERISINVEENVSFREFIQILDQEIGKRGYIINRERRIYAVESGKLIPFVFDSIAGIQNIEILYSNIVALNNAQEFDRVDGISFLFHTSEKCHLNNPHIHARCGEKDGVCYYLKTGKIEGKFKNPAKLKIVKKYVAENMDILLKAWNLLIEEGRAVTKKDLESKIDNN